MIFILHGDLGDQITMLPSVVAYREECCAGDVAAYVVADGRVRALVPSYGWLGDERDIPIRGMQDVVSLNVWRAVEAFGKSMHPTRMFYRYLGLDDSGLDDVLQPEVVVDGTAPVCDYVLAPIANDPARSMKASLFSELLLWLTKLGRVVVLGMRDAWDGYASTGASFLSNRPLPYVAGLMRNARKAVITVDSMPSRLAHAVGVDRHVLLCADVVPRLWGGYPGVRMVYGAPSSWTADAVIGLVSG